MSTYTVTGTYGSSYTPCNIFVSEYGSQSWYVVEGSQNVNRTWDTLEHGVDVELIDDCDYFYCTDGINSESELEQAIEA